MQRGLGLFLSNYKDANWIYSYLLDSTNKDDNVFYSIRFCKVCREFFNFSKNKDVHNHESATLKIFASHAITNYLFFHKQNLCDLVVQEENFIIWFEKMQSDCLNTYLHNFICQQILDPIQTHLITKIFRSLFLSFQIETKAICSDDTKRGCYFNLDDGMCELFYYKEVKCMGFQDLQCIRIEKYENEVRFFKQNGLLLCSVMDVISLQYLDTHKKNWVLPLPLFNIILSYIFFTPIKLKNSMSIVKVSEILSFLSDKTAEMESTPIYGLNSTVK